MRPRLTLLAVALVAAGLLTVPALTSQPTQVLEVAAPAAPVVQEPVVKPTQARVVAPAPKAPQKATQPVPKKVARPVARPHTHATQRASRSRTRVTTSTAGGSIPAVLARIRGCESGSGPTSPGNYRAENSGSTASGAYQFLSGTWRSITHLPPPASAYSKQVQDQAALKLYREQGTSPWNASRHCWG